MRSFKQYITEIGDSSFPWRFTGSDEDGEYHRYHISHPTDSSKDTAVTIIHDYPDSEGEKHGAEVTFRRKGETGNDRFKKTGDMSVKGAANMFATVRDIMRHHAENNPSVSHFEFTSDKSEKSRRKLYDRFTKKIGGEIDRRFEDDGIINYVIPANKL